MNKYRARKIKTLNQTFDSKKEYNRWLVLKEMHRVGEIYNLQRQVKYVISVNGKRVCSYIADFVYRFYENGPDIVEDVKSDYTRKLPVYRLKKKLMLASNGIDILET